MIRGIEACLFAVAGCNADCAQGQHPIHLGFDVLQVFAGSNGLPSRTYF